MAAYTQENFDHIKTLDREKTSAQTKIESLLQIAESGNAPLSIVDRIRENEDKISLIDEHLQKIESNMKKNTLSEKSLLEIYHSLQNTKEPAALKLLAQTIIQNATIDTINNTANIVFFIDEKHFGLRLATPEGFEPPTY